MKRISLNAQNSDLSLFQEVKDIILKGGIVALPTETVYGLGALARSKSAVEKLVALKQRDLNKPFTLVVGNIDQALNIFMTLPPYGYRLIERFWPGPLTLIFYDKKGDKVGIRVPAHEVLQRILTGLTEPIYLPSANISGNKESLSADEVETVFNGRIDLIVDSGAPQYCQPSTVLDITYHPFKILREGVVSTREIVESFVRKRLVFVCTGNTCRSVLGEYLLKKYLFEYDPGLADRYEIISRGVSAGIGCGASDGVLDILFHEEQIGAVDHISQRLDHYTVLSSDLIFTMEESQREYVLQMEPTAEARVFALSKFLPGSPQKDIQDPIGQPKEVYQKAYELIKQSVVELREWL
ncbi:MAG: threonylcarbamoyl-AMP synthase [Candidatus Omnitrophica bacterium]|nr:threonylcarbamoyl-AMP synthase [Candidatus Omnitrophota bacterium]